VTENIVAEDQGQSQTIQTNFRLPTQHSWHLYKALSLCQESYSTPQTCSPHTIKGLLKISIAHVQILAAFTIHFCERSKSKQLVYSATSCPKSVLRFWEYLIRFFWFFAITDRQILTHNHNRK